MHFYKSFIRVGAALLVMAVSPWIVLADGSVPATTTAPQPATQPTLEHWTLHPSRISGEPFRFQLLPKLSDMTSGNAASLYRAASRLWPDSKVADMVLNPNGKRFEWQPIDGVSRKDAEALLGAYADTLHLVDQAARRKDADWSDDLWVSSDGVVKSFYFYNELLHAGNLLSFRARYQVSQNDWNGAEFTLQTLLATARKLDLFFQQKVFVWLAICDGGKEWMTRAGSPNLFWSLNNLPHPFIDTWPTEERERFPAIETGLYQVYRGEQPKWPWKQVMIEMIGDLQEITLPKRQSPAEIEAQAEKVVASTYPRAKQYLLAAGLAKGKVDGMSPDEAVATYFCRESRVAADELWKYWDLPFPQAQDGMFRAWKALDPDRLPLRDNPVFQWNEVRYQWMGESTPQRPIYRYPKRLMVRYMLTEADRDIAIFQVIEALRDYAARHDGNPPARLEEIQDLPLPLDPFTGKPFDYSATGKKARLVALTPWWPGTGWNLEVTFEK